MNTSNQKADGLKVAPILKAGWLLKKRRMDLRSLNKSIAFIRATNDRRRPYHRAGAVGVFSDPESGRADSGRTAKRSPSPLARAGRAIPRTPSPDAIRDSSYAPNNRVQISS